MYKLEPKKRIPIILGGMVVMILLMALLSWGLKKATTAFEESKPGVVHYPQVESAAWVASAEDVCILVQQSYAGVEGHSEPIAEELQAILGRIGVNAILGENKICAAHLSIELTITPIRESVSGAGYCYLAASAQGEAKLAASGHKTLTLALSKPPPNRSGFGIQIITHCPKLPVDAPLMSTWVTAIAPVLNWWGAPALVSAMQSEISEMRWLASNQFSRLGKAAEEAIPVLTDMLADANKDLHVLAANALGSMGEAAESAVPAMLSAYQDAGSGDQTTFLRAFGEIGDTRALSVFIEALQKDEYFAWMAAEALGKWGAKAAPAVPDLMLWLRSGKYQAVTTCAEALGKIGAPAMQAVPELIALLRGSESSFYYSAEHALKAITGQDFGRDAAAWQKWWDAR